MLVFLSLIRTQRAATIAYVNRADIDSTTVADTIATTCDHSWPANVCSLLPTSHSYAMRLHFPLVAANGIDSHQPLSWAVTSNEADRFERTLLHNCVTSLPKSRTVAGIRFSHTKCHVTSPTCMGEGDTCHGKIALGTQPSESSIGCPFRSVP